MNSNRTKCDDVLSTSWNLLTTKSWKSEQEIENKKSHMNGINSKGGFWFRERSTNIKPLAAVRRQSDRHQYEQKHSKTMKFNSLVNHCPLINQYLASNKSLQRHYDSSTEQIEIFSLPEAKVKYPYNLKVTNSLINSNYSIVSSNKQKPFKLSTHHTPKIIDDADRRTKSKMNNNYNNKEMNHISTDSDVSLLGVELTVQPISNNEKLGKDYENVIKIEKPSTVTISTVECSKNQVNHSSVQNIHSLSHQNRVMNGDYHNSDYENRVELKDTVNREMIIRITNHQNEICTDGIKNSKEKSILIEPQKLNQLESRKMSSFGEDDTEPVKSNGKMNIPMTPHTALSIYGKKLTSYERDEILNFSKIWYLGLSAQKIEGIIGSSSNHGYDDEAGGYIKITHDHIAYRFQTLETLGKGSFGRVIRAIDHKSGFPVAIKIIRNKKRFHQQAQVEVAILENLKKADHRNTHNIIHIEIISHFVIIYALSSIYSVSFIQCMYSYVWTHHSNLYDLLRKNDFRGFTIHSLKKIAVKLLSCLCLLRKQGIIHCDLKPENILVGLNNPSELKVIDFGSSCFVHQKTYTYIQSRFYRAPEIILGIPYGPPIDMWSLGCILPELYTGRPLFPGENENEQLACIMEVLGLPSELILEKATRRRVFFDDHMDSPFSNPF
ncbi:unnamed protein product [Heterobilharzia americana]|nr:unnamed protein product [Heterobilharzia americana]